MQKRENENQLLKDLSQNFTVGNAVDDGGCFFDALAQSINSCFPNNPPQTEKSLRKLCHTFYLANSKKIDQWLKDSNELDQGFNYLMVQYTAEEMKDFPGNPPPTWGRSTIEGRIICEALQLPCIHLVELVDDPENDDKKVTIHSKITKGGIEQLDEYAYSNDTPILFANDRMHFLPILPNATLTHAITTVENTSLILNPSSNPVNSQVDPQDENIETLKNRLTDYIRRIESYQGDYTQGFYFFSQSRGINRNANYLLAKQFLDELNQGSDISSVFSDYDQKREEIINQNGLKDRSNYVERGMNSKELSAIIETALNFTTHTQKLSRK